MSAYDAREDTRNPVQKYLSVLHEYYISGVSPRPEVFASHRGS